MECLIDPSLHMAPRGGASFLGLRRYAFVVTVSTLPPISERVCVAQVVGQVPEKNSALHTRLSVLPWWPVHSFGQRTVKTPGS